MDLAIPHDIDKPHESTVTPGGHPAKAVVGEQRLPVIVEEAMLEGIRMEFVDLGVGKPTTPLLVHIHDGNLHRMLVRLGMVGGVGVSHRDESRKALLRPPPRANNGD